MGTGSIEMMQKMMFLTSIYQVMGKYLEIIRIMVTSSGARQTSAKLTVYLHQEQKKHTIGLFLHFLPLSKKSKHRQI